ncbi:hypothetical protein ACFQBQ_04420 [Granulicella cerasi]|uniref:NHL repeat containing protein n=1 Tax=Granulicella cerasi TaxID=741063 RepID=A0ABW1Z5Y9_9BACT|nr:hypothetical protein [Granulicella cerasi]
MLPFRPRLASFAILVASTSFVGCGVGNLATAGPAQGVRLQGHVFGGQQPVKGSHVYLLAANKSGYGGNGYAASTSNASVSLLNAASTGTADSIGAYVSSDANGNFSITGDYTCQPGQQVYVLARGGDSGSGNNAEIANAAVLGDCPTTGSFLASVPFVSVNEVTTVAAAYALAGFATDATHISSSGTAPALIGIKNAFANASNLADLGTGSALATTPAGNGTVPQTLLNMLGNILAGCENTADSTATPAAPSSTCQSLFAATPTATDTFTAMINIAHNPIANISALCALSSSTAPFQPSLPCSTTALPNDFSVAISFADSHINNGASNVAIDSQGNVIIEGNAALVKLTSLGVPYPGSPFSGGGTTYMAIDLQDNIWSLYPAESSSGGSLHGLSASGVTLPGTPFALPVSSAPFDIEGASGLAIDGAGNIFSTESIDSVMNSIRMSYNGTAISSVSYPLQGTSDTYTNALRFDSSRNLWTSLFSGSNVRQNAGTYAQTSGFPVTASRGFAFSVDRSGRFWTSGNSNFVSVSSTGTVTTITPTSYAPGFDMTFDGDNTLWMPYRNGSRLQHFTSAGASIVPGFTSATGPQYIAIDASGDIWLTQNLGSASAVTEVIGAAGPVTTPIALSVKNGTVAARP